MARIGTRLLALEIDGDDYSDQVSSCTVTVADAESGFVSFAAAAGGGSKDFILNVTGAQDMETGSLWHEMWTNPGTSVPCVVAPYGNAVPSATQPHLEGTAVIELPDGVLLGGEANASPSEVMTFEVSWTFTAKPVLKTSAA